MDPEVLPAPALRVQVAGTDDAEWFLESGRRSVTDLERALAAAGRTLESFTNVLDFGCGCGRMDRWLVDRLDSLTGIDIDEGLVLWCAENLPGARFEACPPLPPIRFADGTFDLIINHSVFSHLDEEYQDRWLAELARVAAPGALVVLSFHGPIALHRLEPTPGSLRARAESKGIAFFRSEPRGGPFPAFYQTAVHAPWYVMGRWQRWLDLCAYMPRNNLGYQDAVVMRKPGVKEERVPWIRQRRLDPRRRAIITVQQARRASRRTAGRVARAVGFRR